MTSRLFRIEHSGPGNIVYLWLSPDVELPPLPLEKPFRAIVVSELHAGAARQSAICEWLAASGCRYLMAWGHEASSWDDSMDWAALERSGYVVDADGEDFIPTTWHDGESLAEVLHFAANHAKHPTLELEDLLVLHLAHGPNPEDVLGQGPRQALVVSPMPEPPP